MRQRREKERKRGRKGGRKERREGGREEYCFKTQSKELSGSLLFFCRVQLILEV